VRLVRRRGNYVKKRESLSPPDGKGFFDEEKPLLLTAEA
jgi:hypothetical protein